MIKNGLTEQAKKYATEGTVLLRIVDSGFNHVGPITRRDTTRKNEVVVSVTNAANKKDNMKIDYVNLTTQKQYFQPQYNSTTKQAERQKTTYNKFSQLTYVNYTNVR